MDIKIIKVGNSKGIRIPKTLIDEYNIEDTVELRLKDDCIEIRPKRKPREHWKSQFQKMADNHDDELIIPDVFEDEDL